VDRAGNNKPGTGAGFFVRKQTGTFSTHQARRLIGQRSPTVLPRKSNGPGPRGEDTEAVKGIAGGCKAYVR
jgi:hypothetical protein